MADNPNLDKNKIQSINLRIFPTVSRNLKVSGDTYSRHASEEFLTGIVNKLMDRDGFIITTKDGFWRSDIEKDELFPFMFNIHGYYFRIATLNAIIDNFSDAQPGDIIYAQISLELNGNKWLELYGEDTVKKGDYEDEPPIEDYQFNGLLLSCGKTAPEIPTEKKDTMFVLPLMQKSEPNATEDFNWNNTGWFIPDDFYIKFDGKSFLLNRVDGGDLDEK